MPSRKKPGPTAKPRSALRTLGWNTQTRLALERLIAEGAGRRLPIVFDFDNTLACGDIGEATMAVLARSGVLTPTTVPQDVCLDFRAGGKQLVQMESCVDITEYYEALLEPTAHGARDGQPLANGYAWVVQAMQNLKVTEVIEATRTAWEWADPTNPGRIEVTPGRTAYPVPFFYPEMVDLVATLLQNAFDVWIVSASNAWSVRWAVLNVLNPLLRRRGQGSGLRADHIVGITTLLADRHNRLYKDSVLVREDKRYARLDPSILSRFRLTGQLQYPVPTYSGKIAAIFDVMESVPYLVAGDSPGDLPMLAFGRHRLWIARLSKPANQKTATPWFRKTGRDAWLVQATWGSRDRGFDPHVVTAR